MIILFFFEHVLIMKYIDEHCIIFKISFRHFCCPKAPGALSTKWLDLLEKQMKERAQVVRSYIDILEMHIMQRTIYAPTKTNIDMEGKNGSNFVKNRSQIQNDLEIQIEPSFPSSIYHRCFDVRSVKMTQQLH